MSSLADLKRLPCRPSQRQRIFEKLDGARGQEVPASKLADISLQYCARLKELRDIGALCGFRITNRIEHVGGRVLGYYRLVWDVLRPPAFSISAPVRPSIPAVAAGETIPMFPHGVAGEAVS